MMRESSSRWAVCVYICALGCTQHPDPELSAENRSGELAEPAQEPVGAVAIVQTGQIQRYDVPNPAPYRYSETHYDRAGQIIERMMYRRDGTRDEFSEYEGGRIQHTTSFEPDGRTLDVVRRFSYDDANRFTELRYCSTSAPDCTAWRIDIVETWTPAGRPLTGSVVGGAGTARMAWTYDAKGRLLEKTLGVSVWYYDYDDHGRLKGWEHSFPNDDEGNRWEYEYDDSGRVTEEITRGGFLPVHAVVEYSYEHLLELEPGVTITGVESIVQSPGGVH
jgi:hypothetical protein